MHLSTKILMLCVCCTNRVDPQHYAQGDYKEYVCDTTATMTPIYLVAAFLVIGPSILPNLSKMSQARICHPCLTQLASKSIILSRYALYINMY